MVEQLPATMAAAYVNELGGPENIRYGHLPVPEPGPGDVVIATAGVAVNAVDTFVRSGGFPTRIPFPFIIGRDVAGRVAAAGDEVDRFRVGDPVWCNSLGHATRQGAAAEYALAAQERVYPLPAGVDPVAAVSVVHPAATAHLALTVHGGLTPAETVFIAGGAGHVGSALITFARERGAHVIASASDRDTDYCRGLGADEVVDHHRRDLPDQLNALAPDGVDLAIDTSGRQELATMIALLGQGGRIVVLAGMGSSATLDLGSLYTRDRSLIGFVISNAGAADLAAAAEQINALLARHALESRDIVPMPLSEAARAHDQLERGAVTGRMVLQP